MNNFIGLIMDIDANNIAVKYLELLGYFTKEISHVYSNGYVTKSIMAYGKNDDDEIRMDIINVLNKFNIESAIVKYSGNNRCFRINKNGEENPLKIIYYNGGKYNDLYVINLNGVIFVNAERYWYPKSLDDIKQGMEIEYYNDGVWKKHIVKNPVEEYNNMIKLLIKYNKVRVRCD